MPPFSAPRVLLSAYQCAPGIESVSQIGWQWYSRLSQHVPVTLVTHIRNRPALLSVGAPLPNSDIIFIDTEWFAKPLHWFAGCLFPKSHHAIYFVSFLDFYVYDWVSTRQLQRRQKNGYSWDIIHLVTPVSPFVATRLHTLKSPIVLGPWNGGLNAPKQFHHILRQDANWLQPLRYLGRLIDWSTDSTGKAAIILTATHATVNSIPTHHRSHCLSMIENAVDLDLFVPMAWPPLPSAHEPLRVLYVGRFEPFKAVSLLLQAIARVHTYLPILLTVVGEGPLEKEWKALAHHLGIHDKVTWYGRASHPEVVQQLHQSHVLCLPSVRESGGGVLLEAMSCARPVIAVNFGGPAELVDGQVGHLLPSTNPESVINGLVESFQDIFTHPDKWRQRGYHARKRAESRYGWDTKIEYALTIYRKLLQHK